MRKSIFIFAINIWTLGYFCYSQETAEQHFKFPLKTVYSFCQGDTNKLVSRLDLKYDKENRLIQLSAYFDTIEQSRIKYNYNNLGLLESKEFYSFRDGMNFERKRVFEYDKNLKLISERYDDDKGNNTKYNFTYSQNGQMTTKKEECNYNIRKYNYEYDKQGKLVKMYRDDELETSYEYSGNLLSKEKNYRNNNEVIYEYDPIGLPLIKKQNNKVIEKNIYKNGRLIKSWTSYFGIDPCFEMPCCSQYFRRYEYYE